MRRARYGIVLVAMLSAFAQVSRDAYRNAYRTWRQADPALERDAAGGGASISQRADRAAALATKYGVERGLFLRNLADEHDQKIAWLENAAAVDVPASLTKGLTERVAAERVAVGRNIDTFANDPDKAIQQLRQALERENTSLTALSRAMTARQKAADAAQDAGAGLDQARGKAISIARDLAAGLKQAHQEADRETAAWAAYYRKISEASLGPATSAPATANPAPPRPSSAAITPLPLSRYVGAWTFPVSNGLYHGPQPEFIDLVVHENGGHADGTLFGRFKTTAGGPSDPVVRFDFIGEFKNTRNQVFTLETSDGAKGSIELIPGPAFNLLEVNFQIEPKPGKIRQANVVLVKK